MQQESYVLSTNVSGFFAKMDFEIYALATCHALGPLQLLGRLTINISSVSASGTLTPSPTAFISLKRLNCLRKVRLPCGLLHSLCTLRLLHFSWLHRLVKTKVQIDNFPKTQHAIRAAGLALPDPDFHQARNTKLRLAH